MVNTKLIKKNSTIIVGFSGGPDSIYLLIALKQIAPKYNLKLIAAHLDHQWRSESKQEALWCQKFCDQQNITFVSQKACDIKPIQKYNGSMEAHARQLRQSFFKSVQTKYPQSYIALAHHKEDQIETFFIRLARGSSLAGLCGIKEQDNIYIRPLLHVSKQTILEYLYQHDIPYLKDPSNEDQKHLRNRIRKNLTGNLANIDHRLPNNISKAMQHLQQADLFLNDLANSTLQKLTSDTTSYKINIDQFLNLHSIIQQRILLKLLIMAQAEFTPSQRLFAEIIKFLKSDKSPSHTIHHTYKIKKEKNKFYIEKQW